MTASYIGSSVIGGFLTGAGGGGGTIFPFPLNNGTGGGGQVGSGSDGTLKG